MRDKRWLAVPPALALLLMFGPWRDATPRPLENPTAAVQQPAESSSQKPSAPKAASVPFPDMTQMVCTLAGVCLLGIAIVIALARARRRQGSGGTAIVLRQSLRMSNRHAVHAVQFDDKILLLGECDGSLRVLHASDDPELSPARHLAAAPAEPEDDGAVLKDMVLPRPAPPASVPTRAPARPARQVVKQGLADFRTLLSKTQVEA